MFVNCPDPPVGYRLLQIGETIKDGDLYLTTSTNGSKWQATPITGLRVVDNGVTWVRREDQNGESRKHT
jgi:hypothetical protein